MMKKLSLIALINLFVLFACDSPSKKTTISAEHKDKKEKPIAFDLKNIDSSAKACNDFYQYAIGGWLEDNPVPSTESRWSNFNIVSNANKIKIKRILEDYANKNFEQGSMEQKIGDFYTSIMDSTNAEQLSYRPLQKEISKIEALDSKEELIALVAAQRSIGVNSLFSIYIGQDDKNSTAYITHLSQAGLGLPDRDYYTKTDKKSKDIQKAYLDHIGNIFELLEKENADQLANTAYSIENRLAEASMTKVERRKPENTYNKVSLDDLKSSYPKINWETYFATNNVPEFDSLIVSQPNFFATLNDMMTEISMDNWKTYLKWRLFNAFASDLSSDFVNENFNFYGKVLSGKKEMKPLWKRALQKLNHNIGELVGKAFVEQHFSEAAKKDVSHMVENLRTTFKSRINKLTWMSEETKKQALEKLKAFNYKIGYPDEWRSYKELSITPDNKIKNILAAKEFNFNYMIQKLGKPIDPNEWFMNPQTVNAYYSSSKNEIVFPAGILQAPFYDVSFDPAINYGGIGAVIGHEFTHGFDDQGSKYDAEGNLKNWWTEKDRQRFESRAQKVVKQFNGFEPLDSLYVNGELTLGENIADLGGATLAYHALEKEMQENEHKEKIDGFTYQQRFFLAWAQVWQMNMTNEELRKRIAADPHSPGRYRVNGPLSNMPEFAKAFNCPEGSPMRNKDTIKAEIW